MADKPENEPELTKWFCVGRSGATVDGRTIEPQWIEDMAATYNRHLYGARLNVEHIKLVWPNNDFSGYGDVWEVEVRDVEKTNIKELWARFAVTAKAKKLNADGEKVYSSMEVRGNFAGTGKAYLTGVALTDTPASLGTSRLYFSQSDNQNIFYSEGVLFMDESTQTASQTEKPLTESAFAKIFSGMFKPNTDNKPSVETSKQFADLSESTQKQFGEAAQIIEKLAKDNEEKDKQITALSAQVGELEKTFSGRLDALEKLSQTPVSQERELHSGGEAAILADC